MKNKLSKFSTGKQYWFLYLTFWILFTLGQVQRIQVSPAVAFYGHELVLTLWLFWTAVHYRKKITKKRTLSLMKVPIVNAQLLFVSYIFIQQFFQSFFDFQPLAWLYLLRLYLYLTLGFSLWFGIKHKYINTETLLRTILISLAGIAILGWLQYLIIPDTRFLYNYGWDDHYFRLISTLFDPGFTGLLIAIGGILFIHQLPVKPNWKDRLLIIPLFLTALLLTYSRASYLAFAFGISTWALLSRKALGIFLLLLFICLIPFLPRPDGEGVKLERTASVEARIESNTQALQQLNNVSVITGKGWYHYTSPNESDTPNHATAPDNSFISTFYFLGIIGTVLALNVLWQLGKLFIKNLGIFASFIAILVSSLFNNSLYYPWVIMLLMTFAVAAFYQKQREKKVK